MPARRLTLGRKLLFASMVTAAVAAPLGAVAVYRFSPAGRAAAGKKLNQRAWEATYVERGLDVPARGPREGYWGSRIHPKREDDATGWREREQAEPGFYDIDADGVQHVRYAGPGAARRLLILGGSVAFGAYASSIEQTYFHQAARKLAAAGRPVDIAVLAAGSWRSEHELEALLDYAPTYRPHAAVFLDGLNDLTTFDDDQTPDLAARVDDYLKRMAWIANEAAKRRIVVVIAIQPSLAAKEPLSDIERELLEKALAPIGSRDDLRKAYRRLRDGARALATQWPHVHAFDYADLFNGDPRTTFADLWHFSDPGHDRLAAALVGDLATLLPPTTASGVRPPSSPGRAKSPSTAPAAEPATR